MGSLVAGDILQGDGRSIPKVDEGTLVEDDGSHNEVNVGCLSNSTSFPILLEEPKAIVEAAPNAQRAPVELEGDVCAAHHEISRDAAIGPT